MKKLLLILLSALAAASCAFFCACGEDDSPTAVNPPASSGESGSSGSGSSNSGNGSSNNGSSQETVLQKFTGITFEDKSVTYDGSEHEITVSGTLPAGAKVTYTGNKATDAGTYEASAEVSKDGYETLKLSATLTVGKATFTGITFNDLTVDYDGSEHEITVSGNLPEGTQVAYTDNKAIAAGTYSASATITNPNYNELVLNAELTIVRTAQGIAQSILNAVLFKPDMWAFMPAGLKPDKMAYDYAPLSDFTDFIGVSAIGDRIIGKQLNVLYEGLMDAESALGYAEKVFSAGDAVLAAYQAFISNNPDNYATYTGNVSGLKLKIALDGNNSTLLAGNSTISVELSYDGETQTRTGRIQVTDGIALKYEANDSELKFAVKTTVSGAGNLKEIAFTESNGTVGGYLYEYTGTSGTGIKTSAVIAGNSQITAIMSNKRETDDLAITGYEEVYSSVTGKYIGGEVKETVKLVNFDTLWFMLGDVAGFENVKVSTEANGLNADTIYINDSSAALVTMKVGGLTTRRESRRYDVEMKDVWYVVRSNDGKYEKVKSSIPMLFVQVENAATFAKDIKDNNPNVFAETPALPTYTAVTNNFSTLQALFDTVKENGGYEEIDSYIGTKDEFFN